VIPKQTQQNIMELAVEDCTPFFDVTSTIRGALPNRTENELIDSARRFVIDMLSRGYIGLYYDCWAKSTEQHRHVEDLSPQETVVELADRANWLYHKRRPPDERWVTIVATGAGERALLAGEFAPGLKPH